MTNGPPSEKATRVRAMFSRIAGRYDLMNALMTFGMDGRWREATARAVRPAGGQALDLGAGTGDLALALARAGAKQVVALDFSQAMLVRALEKTARGNAARRVRLVGGDALRLPFPDEAFDVAANGFVLRNVADLAASLAEMRRVLRPGGRIACLDLTHPPPTIAPVFRPYFEHIVPAMGRLIAGDAAAYRYLPDSVRPFPDAAHLAGLMRAAGFVNVRYQLLGLGVVCLHTAMRPPG